MTVRCPRCGTLYRRPARSGVGADATFRCARCRHVFETTPDEPSLIGDEPELVGDEEDDDAFAFDEEEDDAEPPPAPRPAARPRTAPREPLERGPVTPARFAVRALVLVTLAYAILSVWLHTHPGGARQVLRRVPLIGSQLAETGLDPATVQLANVRGEYQRVHGDQLVFVVSGTAVNDSPLPVRAIQIQARIVGAEERRQVVFCGAAPRDVQNLSLREIALLQTIEPPKDWSLAPGEETTFLVVFPTPPQDLRQFGAEVVAVRAPKRRA